MNKQNIRNSTSLQNSYNKQNLIYRSINYPGTIAHKIQSIFRKFDINMSFKNVNTLHKKLFNAKDQIKLLDQNGVYKLECGTCGASYIGETGRSLKTRIKEHKRNDNSNFGRHMIIYNHEFDENKNVTLLHKQNKGYKLNLLETYEIEKFKHNNEQLQCLNDQIHINKTPLYKFLNNPFPQNAEE